MSFEIVTEEEFVALIEAHGSKRLRERFAGFNGALPAWGSSDCAVHRGPLSAPAAFRAPAYNTLIIGDLTVEGMVDLGNPEGYDEGGMFVVIGNIVSKSFVAEYGKCTFVDGHLAVRDIIVNAFEDSSLVVTGDLRTTFFYGEDIWAEVGGTAEMAYGVGYCLPLRYTDAARQAIRPRYDEEDSRGQLVPGGDERCTDDLVTALRAGQPIFK